MPPPNLEGGTKIYHQVLGIYCIMPPQRGGHFHEKFNAPLPPHLGGGSAPMDGGNKSNPEIAWAEIKLEQQNRLLNDATPKYI